MDNELTIRGGQETLIVKKDGLANLIKPLTNEIHLFDTFVAGTTHLEDKKVLEDIKAEDKLILKREDNKFDSNAIIIYTQDKKKLGYVPEADNLIFARLMDAGKMLMAKISSIDKKGNFYKISIGIYMVDF